VVLVAFESNRPRSAVWYGGEKSLASLEPTIKEHVFPPVFPNDSKARLWREIRVVCKPEAGCDAYFQLPTRIDIPSGRLDMNLVKPEMPSWIKMLTIQLQPE
jgi:hypothetical protein